MRFRQLTVVHSLEMKNQAYQHDLGLAGYQFEFVPYSKGIWSRISTSGCKVMLLDTINFCVGDIKEILTLFLKRHPQTPAVFLNSRGLQKADILNISDWSTQRLNNGKSDRKALKKLEVEIANSLTGTSRDDERLPSSTIIGDSPELYEVFEVIRRAAPGDANILVTGESGVGKELVTRSIHQQSERWNQPFIAINCGALPPSLFESELFGYEQGAFTGARSSKVGLIELANGGTLFLDEICEMAPDLQVKLLRVLEERTLRRLGGRKEISVDIRLLSATNQDINKAIASKSLRSDLFFRISTIHLKIPPLRERVGDISILANHFLQELERKNGSGFIEISTEATEILERHSWPGNVRELRNVIEHAYYLGTPPTITPMDLDGQLGYFGLIPTQSTLYELAFKEAKETIIEEFEKEYLLHHLKKHAWHISKTALASGIDRRTIHRLIRKYDIKR